MAPKSPYQKNGQPFAAPRPGQDFLVAKKQAAQFPAVGMTLPSYNSTGNGRARRRQSTQSTAGTSRWQTLRHRFLTRMAFKRLIVSVVIVVLCVGGWLGFKFIYNAHKLFGGSIFSALSTTKLKGESSGRVNILLAGNSADDPGHDGANLTDSILILSIDTRNNTAFMLSVPRDLWVNIPGGGYQKINDAYVVGQNDNFSQAGYPNGGMGLLEQIVSQDFGIPIDYYALINYAALKDAVDAVGGISVNIQSSDPRGLYDPSIDYATHGPLVKLTNGVHTLDGEQALDLARARGDSYGAYGFAGGDFERTTNQRLMLVALKNKITTTSTLANPIKLSDLFDAIGSNLTTDMKFPEVHRLYDLTKNINSSNIQSLSLNNANGQNLLANFTSRDGEEALMPAAGLDDYSDIQAYVQQQTSSNPVVREDANVVILNATNTDGLASQERTTLKLKNLNITAVGDANANQQTTTVIDNSNGKQPATKQLLTQLFGNNFTTVNPYSSQYPTANFIILVGEDKATAPTTAD